MQVEVNGVQHEVAAGRDALALGGPHDELIIVYRRADGAMLQFAGSNVSGFVADVDGGHTGRRTSASHSIPATAVGTMLDRFAAGDTGWPGATVWRDDSPQAAGNRAPKGAVLAIVVLMVSAVAAVLIVVVVRRQVTVPWLCDRDDRELESIRLGGGGIDGRADECLFAGGVTERMVEVAGALGWAEVFGSVLAIFVLWFVLARLMSRLIFR